MTAMLTVAGFLYVILAIAGLIISGMPIAYWKGALRPVMLGTFAGSEGGRRSPLAYRVAGTVGLAAFLALLTIVMSPLSVYRAIWEIWHRATRPGQEPPPPKEPAVAKRVKAL